MIFWKIAARNILRHYRRSLSTGLAVGLGFAGVVLLGGYMLRMDSYLATQGIYLNHVGHLSVYKKDGLERTLSEPDRYSLTLEDQARIQKAANELPEPPEFIGKNLVGQGLITNGCRSTPFSAVAIEPEVERRIRSHPAVLSRLHELVTPLKGQGFWNPDQPNDVIAVSFRIAEILKKPLVAGDPTEDAAAMAEVIMNCEDSSALARISQHSGIQLVGTNFTGNLAAADARIGSHYTTGLSLSDDSATLMPLNILQQFYSTDKITSMSLYLQPTTWTPQALAALRTSLGEQFDVYTYYDDRVNPYYVGSMNFVYVMTIFFLVLVCGVIALSILNSLQISLLERKTEIGTLRAIGFRTKMIRLIFVRETIVLCTISLLGGGVLATIIASTINSMDIRFMIVGTAGTIQFVLLPGFWFSVLVALIFLGVSTLTASIACRRYLRKSVVSLLETAA